MGHFDVMFIYLMRVAYLVLWLLTERAKKEYWGAPHGLDRIRSEIRDSV